jgi:hypothetical protein
MGVHVNEALWSKKTFLESFELFEDAIYDQFPNTRAKRLWSLINDKADRVELVIDESGGGIMNFNDYGHTQFWVNYRDGARRELLGDALGDAREKFHGKHMPRNLAQEKLSIEITLKPTLWDVKELGADEWRSARYGVTLAHEFVIHAAFNVELLQQIVSMGTDNLGRLQHVASIWNGLGDEREQHRAVFENDQFGLNGEYKSVVRSMIKFTNNVKLKGELKEHYLVDVKEHSSQETILAAKDKVTKFFGF